MKLILYELRKLSYSRFVLSCIAVLLILNTVLCSLTIKINNPLPEKAVEDIYSSYLSDAQSVNDIYEQYEADYCEYEIQYKSYVKRGGIEPLLPENYWLPTGMSDKQLYDKLYADVNRTQTYRNSIENVIKSALTSKAGLENNGNTSSYEYLYQQEIIDRYTSLYNNVYIGFENTRGYDLYIECRIPLFLSIIAGAVIASYFYTAERANASLSLIRCTKKGRFKLTAIKIAAAYITTFAFFVISQLTAVIITGNRIGFGSLYNGIQAYESFTYCPFNLTVLQCCIIDFSLKSVCLFFFVSAFILVAARTDYLIACAINISISAGVIGIYYITQNNAESILHLINPMSLAFDSLFRYRAVNLFGTPCQAIAVICLILVLSAIICAVISGFIFAGSAEKILSFSHKKRKIKVKTEQQQRTCSISMSLFMHELYKVLCNRAVIVSMLVYIVLTAIIVPYEVGEQSTDEAKLQDYIQSSLYGNITDEKLSYVSREGVRLYDAYTKYDDNVDDYYKGKLSLEQFKPIADERAYADSRNNAYEKLKLYSEYLSANRNENEIWFVYETGWSEFFSDSNMIVTVIVICFVSSIIVGMEYVSTTSNGGFHQILRTTSCGRSITYKNKLLIMLGIIFVIHTTRYVFQYVITDSAFSLNGLDAPLKSLSMFQNHFMKEQSIGFFLFLHYLYQLVVCIILGLFVMEITYIFKRGIISFVSVSACCILPTLAQYIGIKISACFSFFALMNLTNLNEFPAIACIIILISVTVMVTIYSYRKFNQ